MVDGYIGVERGFGEDTHLHVCWYWQILAMVVFVHHIYVLAGEQRKDFCLLIYMIRTPM